MSAEQLPPGWRKVKFGDVVRDVKNTTKDPATDGLERVVGLDHLDPESLPLRRWDELADLPDGTSFTRTFKAGQVLFGKRRAYQRKVAVPDFDGICSGDILVFEPSSPDLLPEFLPYLVQSDGFFDHALGTSAGSLSPRTKWQELAKYEFALPPLDEQKRIAEALETATNLAEAFNAAAAQVDVVLTALENEVAERSVGEDRSTAVVDLVEADRPVTYGILKPGTGHPGGVPVVKVRDFPDGSIRVEDLLLTSPKIDDEFKRSRLRSGDILISIRGTVGRVAPVPPALEGANITQDTARLSIRPEHDGVYVLHMLRSRFVQRQLHSRTTGLAVRGINIGELRKVLIPTPALEEQRALAQRLSQLVQTKQKAQQSGREAALVARALREDLLSGRVQ